MYIHTQKKNDVKLIFPTSHKNNQKMDYRLI